jgi:hypothetical protein
MFQLLVLELPLKNKKAFFKLFMFELEIFEFFKISKTVYHFLAVTGDFFIIFVLNVI